MKSKASSVQPSHAAIYASHCSLVGSFHPVGYSIFYEKRYLASTDTSHGRVSAVRCRFFVMV